jgi:mRNA interferase HigB
MIAKRTLRQFWQQDRRFADAKRALEDRCTRPQAGLTDWATPANVKAQSGNASILKDSRVVFNICGNKYRLIVKINYPHRVVYIRSVEIYTESDMIAVETI